METNNTLSTTAANVRDGITSPEMWANFSELGVKYGLNVIAVILILIIGFWLAGSVNKLIVRIGEKNEKLDNTLFKFLGSVARYVV